jgi:hypothetical protein
LHESVEKLIDGKIRSSFPESRRFFPSMDFPTKSKPWFYASTDRYDPEAAGNVSLQREGQDQMPEIVVPEWVVHGTGAERTPIYSSHVNAAGTHLATGGGGKYI